MQIADMTVGRLAEEIPARGFGWDDIGLIAAVHDDIVRALLGAKMLTAEVPADVHQLNGVERAPALPRRARGMSTLAIEAVLRGDQARATGYVTGPELGRDLRPQHHVQIAKQTVLHHV